MNHIRSVETKPKHMRVLEEKYAMVSVKWNKFTQRVNQIEEELEVKLITVIAERFATKAFTLHSWLEKTKGRLAQARQLKSRKKICNIVRDFQKSWTSLDEVIDELQKLDEKIKASKFPMTSQTNITMSTIKELRKGVQFEMMKEAKQLGINMVPEEEKPSMFWTACVHLVSWC